MQHARTALRRHTHRCAMGARMYVRVSDLRTQPPTREITCFALCACVGWPFRLPFVSVKVGAKRNRNDARESREC